MSASSLDVRDSWRQVRLTEVAELNPRRFSNSITDDTIVSFVPMKAVEEESGRLDPSDTRRWATVKKGYTPFQDNDVLFAKITPCMENGKYAIARGLHGGRAAGSTEFHVFRPSCALDPHFLLYFLFSSEVRRAARLNMRGAAGQLRVPPLFFENLELPLPPIDQQREIVAEIEKQFTRLEAGVAGLRRVQANLKRYRAAVLKAACEGKLVPTEAELARQEGRTYETGAQLLDRILTERRQRWHGKGSYKDPVKPDTANLPTLPEGWVWATLDQAFVVERGRFSIRPRNDPRYYDGPHPFVQIGDLPRDGGNILRYSQSLNDEGLKISKKFRSGTILVAIVGATIANTGVLTFDSCCPDSLVAIQSDSSVRLRLCEIYLRSIKLRLRSVSYASGGQPNINLATLLPLSMPLPPLGEQERIVAELERRLSVVEELEAVVNTNFQRATRLRQSILQRAFVGEIVL